MLNPQYTTPYKITEYTIICVRYPLPVSTLPTYFCLIDYKLQFVGQFAIMMKMQPRQATCILCLLLLVEILAGPISSQGTLYKYVMYGVIMELPR